MSRSQIGATDAFSAQLAPKIAKDGTTRGRPESGIDKCLIRFNSVILAELNIGCCKGVLKRYPLQTAGDYTSTSTGNFRPNSAHSRAAAACRAPTLAA